MTSSSKRLAILGAAAAVLLVAIVAFATTRSSSSSSAASPDGTASTSSMPVDPLATSSVDPAGSSGSVDPDTSTPSDPGSNTPRTAPPVPLDVSVSSTTNVVDGQEVNVHVAPQSGFNAYGAEAFLCRADTTFILDADIRPTQTGKCISKPLSPGSNDYVKVAASPPYSGFDLTFKVGVGTDSYAASNGQQVTITCGPGHPCQLVLKLQFTKAFGFQAYPVTYR